MRARASLMLAFALASAGCGGGCSKAAKDKATASDAAPSASSSSGGGGAFQGAVAMHVTSAPGHVDQDVTYRVKATFVRIDEGSQSSQGARSRIWSVVDLHAHRMITVLDSMRAFKVLDLSADAGRDEAWTHRKLGTSGRVADRDCVDWESKSQGRQSHTVVSCMASERLFDIGSMGASLSVPMPWMSGLDGFPMRSVETDESGREVARTEVKSVTAMPVPDDQLVVPSAYRTLEADTPNVTTGRMRK